MNTDFSVTERIIGAAYRVHNGLGFGYLENVYVRALSIELTNEGIQHSLETPVKVFYREQVVGDFRADLLVNDEVIVEVKAVSAIVAAHEAQLLNYLRATGLRVGLLINFGTSVTVKRRVL